MSLLGVSKSPQTRDQSQTQSQQQRQASAENAQQQQQQHEQLSGPRRLSFHKRPLSAPVRRTSQMSLISNYPPQEIAQAPADDDYVAMQRKYRGVSFCAQDGDFNERIRYPQMSLSSILPGKRTSSGSGSGSGLNGLGGPNGASGTEITRTSTLDSLREEPVSQQPYNYKPASYDLTKNLRSIDNTPPRLNPNFSINAIGLRKSSVGNGSESSGVSPSRLVFSTNPHTHNHNSSSSNNSEIGPLLRSRQQSLAGTAVTPPRRGSSIISYPSPMSNYEPTHSHWKQDKSRTQCYGCNNAFSMFLRRHHCRHCGEIFCGKCLNHWANLNLLAKFERPSVINGGQMYKICEGCHNSYLKFLANGDQYEGQKMFRNSSISSNASNGGAAGVLSGSGSIPSDWAWSSF